MRVLEYLLQFLAHVSEHADINKMHAHNLAVVIAPNILHSRYGNVHANVLMCVSVEVVFV